MSRWIEETFHPHWRVRFAADEVLHEVKTAHQQLVVFRNRTWGTVLMLDGVTQLTTSDEFVYHEMMAHVPLMQIERPRRVLVIGGGDGGVLREVLKHPSVEKATLCEIDRTVIDAALAYFPSIPGKAFDDPRTDLVIGDGLAYIAQTSERFDAIIVDSSEPIGPSAALHSPAFFTDCRRALAPGGVLVTQNGLPFTAAEHLESTTRALSGLFARVAPYLCTQPCYFGGPFALNWASDSPHLLAIPETTLARRQSRRRIATRYWTPAAHRAAFALPAYIQEVVERAMARSVPDRPSSAGVGKSGAARSTPTRRVRDKAGPGTQGGRR